MLWYNIMTKATWLGRECSILILLCRRPLLGDIRAGTEVEAMEKHFLLACSVCHLIVPKAPTHGWHLLQWTGPSYICRQSSKCPTGPPGGKLSQQRLPPTKWLLLASSDKQLARFLSHFRAGLWWHILVISCIWTCFHFLSFLEVIFTHGRIPSWQAFPCSFPSVHWVWGASGCIRRPQSTVHSLLPSYDKRSYTPDIRVPSSTSPSPFHFTIESLL